MKVLITGATGELGRELAIEFALKGYNIIMFDRNEGKLYTLKEKIEEIGCKCQIILGDFLQDEIIERIKSIIISENVDVLVNNIGRDSENITKLNFINVKKLNEGLPPAIKKIFINSTEGLNPFNNGEYAVAKKKLKEYSDTLKLKINQETIFDYYLTRIINYNLVAKYIVSESKC